MKIVWIWELFWMIHLTAFSMLLMLLFYRVAAPVLRRGEAYRMLPYLQKGILFSGGVPVAYLWLRTATTVFSVKGEKGIPYFFVGPTVYRCAQGILLAEAVVGVAVFLRMLVPYVRFCLWLRGEPLGGEREQRVLEQQKQALGIRQKIVLHKSRYIPDAIFCGLFRKRIVLPDTELSEPYLAMVLQHELMHARRHDERTRLLELLLRALYWYNPLLSGFFEEANEWHEYACDDNCIERWDAKAYYAGLMDVSEIYQAAYTDYMEEEIAAACEDRKNGRRRKRKIPKPSSYVMHLSDEGKYIKRRIVMSQKLKQSEKLRLWQRLATTAVALALFGICTVWGGFLVARAGEVSVAIDAEDLSQEQSVSKGIVTPLDEAEVLAEKEGETPEEPLLGTPLPEGNEYVTGDADLYIVEPGEYEDYTVIEMPLPEIGYLATIHTVQWTIQKQHIEMTEQFYIEKGSVFYYNVMFDSSVRMYAGLVLPSGALAGYYLYNNGSKAIQVNVSGYFRFFVQHQWTAPEEVNVGAMYKWE